MELERKAMDILKDREANVYEIAAELGISPNKALMILSRLEAMGIVSKMKE